MRAAPALLVVVLWGATLRYRDTLPLVGGLSTAGGVTARFW